MSARRLSDEKENLVLVPHKTALHMDTINSNLLAMKYAVRGRLVLQAGEYEKQLKDGNPKGLPFNDIVYCNIGNPQSVGQQPVTWVRQVLACCLCPALMETPDLFPADVIERAKAMIEGTGGCGLGAYSESKGVLYVRQSVAEFIQNRDGHPSNPNNIFLTNGASDGVKLILNMLIRDPSDGIMVPIPQYPLYSASITLFGGTLVGYELDETKEWSLSVDLLEEQLKTYREKGTVVRALCVINPGNPTGQLLSEENMIDVVRFCEKEGLVLLADEVYQSNVYQNEFVSFKKVVCELNAAVQLVSYHSVSKGARPVLP